jgi:tetratricopeptide (TPR) repeat protein
MARSVGRAWYRILWAGLSGFALCSAPVLAASQTDQAESARYSQEAEQALARKDLESARVALEKLSHLTPQVAEVFGNLGIVYYSEGRFTQAAEALESALRLNPKLPDAQLMLGICFAETGRNQEAVSILEPAFKSPPNPQVGRLMGLELHRAYALLGQNLRADATVEELLRRYPDDAEILYNASRFHTDRALKLSRRLFDVAPESVWMHLTLAQVHEAEKHYDVAIAEYRTALKMDPQLHGAHFDLGRALLLKGGSTENYEHEAFQEFEQELALNPKSADAEYEIGEIYRRRGQLDDARDHFSKAVQYLAEFENAQIGLAKTLMSLNEPRQALPHLLQAVHINSRNEVSHFLLARVYQSLGDSPDQQKEMALYQKYHVRAYSAGSSAGPKATPDVSNSETTNQTLDSDTPVAPQ